MVMVGAGGYNLLVFNETRMRLGADGSRSNGLMTLPGRGWGGDVDGVGWWAAGRLGEFLRVSLSIGV